MVIDSHEHIMFPTKIQLDRMDAAGVDKAILFCSAPHPEKAGNLNELETEMNALYKILAGANKKEDNMKRLEKNILQFPALTLCNSANGGKALIFRRFRHLPFGRVIRISRRIPA